MRGEKKCCGGELWLVGKVSVDVMVGKSLGALRWLGSDSVGVPFYFFRGGSASVSRRSRVRGTKPSQKEKAVGGSSTPYRSHHLTISTFTNSTFWPMW